MRDPKESEKAIRAFSARIIRRARAAGDQSLLQEDIEQECWIAWIAACKKYDPERGVPFLAFLRTGLKFHVNRVFNQNVNWRHEEVMALSLDARPESASGEGDMTLAEAVPDDAPPPGTEFERRDMLERAKEKLSPEAAQFLDLLYNQPEALLQEVTKIRARAEFAREKFGLAIAARNDLTADMIFTLMGVSRVERTKIRAAIEKLGIRTCRMLNR